MNMRLHIEKGVTLEMVQKQFNEVFPFLKLEFSFPGNGKKKAPLQLSALSPCENSAICTPVSSGMDNIHIDRQMTVSNLEAEFFTKAGLKVLVYRKSGNVWIETSLTNDWTLEKQNSEGQSISQHKSPGYNPMN